jgi:WD40 repeat protein
VAQRLRIFVSSPGDVKAAREIAALTIERLAQDYARFLHIEPYLWEFEAMVASGHFQDAIEPPSAFDVVVLIVWSRLGISLPLRTALREYRGLDGRAPVTGTEWEFEEALQAARRSGTPDILVYRNQKPAPFDTQDVVRFEEQAQQLKALNAFWERHFVNQGLFIGAYTSFTSDAEFAVAFEGHLRRLIKRRIAEIERAHADAITSVWTQAPFVGLEAYEFEHAPIFFGQDEALAKAMLQLTRNADAGLPFLLVLGASGSGKSSLVKAGILPKLFVPRRVPGTAFLRRIVFRPSDALQGEDLFDALARILTTPMDAAQGLPELVSHGQSVASFARHLRTGTAAPGYPIETALGQITVTARQSGRMLEYETAKAVLVIDQLEELFTIERIPSSERRQFAALLGGLARSGLIWIVATMRRDFWYRADETPELLELSEGDRRLELTPPTPAQLSQMIRRPAEAAGVGFEVNATSNMPLNDVISEEVARSPGALPILSYLLHQLYRNDVLEAGGRTLTYVTYEGLGRLEGAIATKAESVLERCTADDRRALGSVLFALVEMDTAEGDIERAVARRVLLSTFPPGTPQRRLVNALLDPSARLLVRDAGESGTPTVRITHEALISRWSQAREFVQSNAEALKIRRRLDERHALWLELRDRAMRGVLPEGGHRRRGRQQGLLTDIDLLDGRRLLGEHRGDTEPYLVAFIERSIADDRRVRTRTVRVLSGVACLVTILAIVASLAGFLASQRQREAEHQTEQARKAESRLLTDAAKQRLASLDVASARSIILEVLTGPEFAHEHSPASISAFQDIRAADAQIAVLAGHTLAVIPVAYSPDGAHIATGSRDKTLRIWDARTGAQLASLSGHDGPIYNVEYSRDGLRMVSSSKDNTARVWDVRSGSQLAVLTGHTDFVLGAAFSPDGTRIVTSSNDRTARIWDSRTGAQLAILPGHGGAVWFTAFSPDGEHIATVSEDKLVRLWDARTAAQVGVLTGHQGPIYYVSYSPDGSRLATASLDKSARIWDAKTGTLLSTLLGHDEGVFSVNFSPDGSRVVTASEDHTARIWDAKAGTSLAVLSGHGASVFCAVYSPDGERIATASGDRTARIWDAHAGGQRLVLSGHDGSVQTAAFSQDNSRVLTASDDRTARVWDPHTGKPLIALSGHEDKLFSAAFSPDALWIATASQDGTARIWDTRTGALRVVLSGHGSPIYAIDVSPDGTLVATGSYDKSARIWDSRTGAQLLVLTGHNDGISFVSFSHDGSRLATSSTDKTARIWDVRSGAQLLVISGHGASVLSASFSPDDARILTSSADNSARIWDARTGAQIVVLSGHSDSVVVAKYSHDGARIVTASSDKTARVWDASTGTQLTVLSGHSDALNGAAFSSDGLHIVTASTDRTARIWDALVPADISAQIAWESAAQLDSLSDIDRERFGLPVNPVEAIRWSGSSDCDKAAAAYYDPDRRAIGVSQSDVIADIAYPACSAEAHAAGHSARNDFQFARALVAKGDAHEARQRFESAISSGYSAARVDLADFLLRADAGLPDTQRAIFLYEAAWADRVPLAASKLGHFYEGMSVANAAAATSRLKSDASQAWSWYQKGADVREPSALARFAERDETAALGETDTARADALLLSAFRFYARAVEAARGQGWPNEIWRIWSYRRATLARLLAREELMSQVAGAYSEVLAEAALQRRR